MSPVSFPRRSLGTIPTIKVECEGRSWLALVDTGCTQSMISERIGGKVRGDCVVAAVDDRLMEGIGEKTIEVVAMGKEVRVTCLVLPRLVNGFEIIIGMDVINLLNGICIQGSKVLLTHETGVAAVAKKSFGQALEISDKDFAARFDGNRWEVEWKWKGGPPMLNNKVDCYKMDATRKGRFDVEIEKWISKGWLTPCEAPPHGFLAMMAVEQTNKGKVRPVFDFRELNNYVESFTGNSDACCDTIRKWRSINGKLAVLDLRDAYMQLHVKESLWQYQIVKHNGKFFKLTRLGFGLNCAPKIMSTILRKVLSVDPVIKAATDHYIDDIIINEDSVSVHQVAEHLRRYGLETKPPEVLDNARVLGLQLSRQLPGRKLWWARGNTIPEVDSLTDMSRKELFSICGKLVGHYPVVGWLRVACSYIKRHAGGSAWDDKIGNRPLAWIKEVVKRVQSSDPVQGVWFVPADRPGRVWCDASSLAIGVALDIDGQTVEDACWLRKKDDSAHINVAELDAVLRGVNMALKWQMKEIVLVTDSATVRSWLTSILSGSHRIRTSGIAEMLVRRRLSMIDDLKNEYDLVMHVELVSSAKNKADVLTRVPQVWLKNEIQQSVVAMHERHHFGMERTLHLAQQVDPTVTRKEVEMVVAACRECKSIDPAPVRWEHGELNVKSHWQRVAADVTHFGRERYLTLVDCGPSRFAIWRRIRSEEVSIVSAIFEEIFRERGPPEELLLDNSSTFRSRQLAQVCETWNVRRVFRCALRPAGNGIIERHHRTIKRQAARSGKNPLDIVF